ncbi:hypothetical protein IKF15_03575 [Candidatus Saccharibacteria bacterium]|nr:hypothetical protein [Candidatus Saccharibacteria bacterium]
MVVFQGNSVIEVAGEVDKEEVRKAFDLIASQHNLTDKLSMSIDFQEPRGKTIIKIYPCTMRPIKSLNIVGQTVESKCGYRIYLLGELPEVGGLPGEAEFLHEFWMTRSKKLRKEVKLSYTSDCTMTTFDLYCSDYDVRLLGLAEEMMESLRKAITASGGASAAGVAVAKVGGELKYVMYKHNNFQASREKGLKICCFSCGGVKSEAG